MENSVILIHNYIRDEVQEMVDFVGGLRKKDRYYKMFVISHNTLRGRASGSVLNVELSVKNGCPRWLDENI